MTIIIDDEKYTLCPEKGRRNITLAVFKAAYIGEGLSPSTLADRYSFDLEFVYGVIDEHGLEAIRVKTLEVGLERLQEDQLKQAEHLMNIELSFKRMKIIQLETKLKDLATYYEFHGDFYKRDPHTKEILENHDGIPIQLSLPNITKELGELEKALTISEGVRNLAKKLPHTRVELPSPSTKKTLAPQLERLFDQRED